MSLRPLFDELVSSGTAYDLSHDLSHATPTFPFHKPYSLSLHRRHGDTVRPECSSFANELIVTSAHASTHIDAIGHFSRAGKVRGGKPAREIETEAGLSELDAADIGPIWSRGVLLDIPRVRGCEQLAAAEPVSADDLAEAAGVAGTELRRGDTALVRTGWAREWGHPEVFGGAAGGYPGVTVAAARWLADRGVTVVGADTPALEVAPSVDGSVHALLIVDYGIPIVENLNLEQLAAAGIGVFLFVALPLRLVGATASPIRPLAIC